MKDQKKFRNIKNNDYNYYYCNWTVRLKSDLYDEWVKNQLNINKEEFVRTNYFRFLPGININKKHTIFITTMVFSTMIHI